MRRIWRGVALFLILGRFKKLSLFFLIICSVLVDEWGGGHRVKVDEKEEEVPSSLRETQGRAVRENELAENEMLKTKAEMTGDEQLAQKDKHEKLSKRGVEDGKKKPGTSKHVADEIRAKKEKEKKKEKHAKKTKESPKTWPKLKSKSQMCDNKYLEKKRLKLKVKAAKLKEQRSKMRKAMQSAKNKRKCSGKEVQEKAISHGGNSRDTECCNNKWAAYTSLGLGLAPVVIKQVDNFSSSFKS